MKQKIMMLTSIWKPEFICQVTSGVFRRIQNEDYDLYIFNAYDMRGNENCFVQEHRIYRLPDLEDYVGVIIAINSDGTEYIVREMVERCRKQNKHVFCIDQKFEGACFAGIDNYSSMYNIVEHMIKVHDCKVFNFLGGTEENAENKKRYQAFCDCLSKYGLEVIPERVSHRAFLQSDGRRAYRDWKEKNLHLPDAVVCANDEMALGYHLASQEDGLYAPTDYRLTGFDNVEDGQNGFPSISSIKRNWEELGYKCADAILGSMEEKREMQDIVIPGDCVLNESCGCACDDEDDGRNARLAFARLYTEKKDLEREGEKQRLIRQALCECEDEKELQQRISESCDDLNISKIAVSISQNKRGGEKGYPTKMRVLCGEESEIIDTRKQLVPSKWLEDKEPQIFLFGGLYCGKNPSGYAVIHYEPNFLRGRLHKTFLRWTVFCAGRS